ncbi:hypothetical protein [Catellatospora sichuanensis]|uniref:hypothetical protein n=1 Tax=Catellatospora sichuanensis TaxID=1969805 RepID=UPI0011828186|nr:hypothetical protein [Catellatospora sichuanensis]
MHLSRRQLLQAGGATLGALALPLLPTGPAWHEVPGGGRTRTEPSVTIFNGNQELFVVGYDRRIYRNTSGSNFPFTSWLEVEGGGVAGSTVLADQGDPDKLDKPGNSDAVEFITGPNAVAFSNELYLFIRGTNDRVYYNKTGGGPFGQWQQIQDQKFYWDVSGVVFLNQLYVFATRNKQIYACKSSGGAFDSWGRVPTNGQTDLGPCAVVFDNVLNLFVCGTDGRIYRNSSIGGPFFGWLEVEGGGRTRNKLCAVAFGNTLNLFAVGTDNRIYRNESTGGPFGSWLEVGGNGRTLSGLTATVFNNRIRLYARGTNNAIYVNDI